MKRHIVWILFCLSALNLGGCDKIEVKSEGNDRYSIGVRLKKNIGLDMKTVVGFSLLPTDATGQGKLFALSTTGSVVPVSLFDFSPDGSPPKTIYNVGNFVFFVGKVTTDAGDCQMIVLQKSDGALYCGIDAILSCEGLPNCAGGIPQDTIVQANADGTLIHAWGAGQFSPLLRLDFADPASAVSKIHFDQADGSLGFFVSNQNGDVLANIVAAGSSAADLRLFKRDGGFVELPDFSSAGGAGWGLCTFAGLGADGDNFYAVIPPGTTSNLEHKVMRIGLAAGEVTTATYADDTTGGLALGICKPGVSQASTLDRHFIFFPETSSNPSPDNKFTEVYNPAGVPVRRTIPELSSVVSLLGCDDQLILRGRDLDGKDVLARYSPDAGTTAIIEGTRGFSISAVAVSKSCEITFGGRRAADNSRILGNIPAGSNVVKVYSSSLPGDVKQLVRIN